MTIEIDYKAEPALWWLPSGYWEQKQRIKENARFIEGWLE